MNNKLYKITIEIFLTLLFATLIYIVIDHWDTTPPAVNLPECVDGTVRVGYGNCVLPEELRKNE